RAAARVRGADQGPREPFAQLRRIAVERARATEGVRSRGPVPEVELDPRGEALGPEALARVQRRLARERLDARESFGGSAVAEIDLGEEDARARAARVLPHEALRDRAGVLQPVLVA